MSDKNASNDLALFIEERIAANRKSVRMTWVVGLILAVIAACYMSAILFAFKTALEPMTAARMIRDTVEQNVPTVLSGIEENLKNQAIPIAEGLDKAILDALPKLREEAQAQIDLTYQQFLPLLKEEIRSTVKAYVIEHEEELRTLYKEHKSEEFVKEFVDEISREIAVSFDSYLKSQNVRGGLAHVDRTVLTYVQDLDTVLKDLAGKKAEEMSNSERLQRRLIVSWLQLFSEKMKAKEALDAAK